MGNTFEIEVWGEHGLGGAGDHSLSYKTFWRGESLIAAMWNMRKAKKQGFGCVTLHWRGV